MRREMEDALGVDLREVRIHSSRAATDAARANLARAYTVGKDVVFGSPGFDPSTVQGKRLLAHELAHVIQQSGRNRAAGAGSATESEAVRASATAAAGGSTRVQLGTGIGIQRQGMDEQELLRLIAENEQSSSQMSTSPEGQLGLNQERNRLLAELQRVKAKGGASVQPQQVAAAPMQTNPLMSTMATASVVPTPGPFTTPLGPFTTPTGPIDTPLGPFNPPTGPIDTPLGPVDTGASEEVVGESVTEEVLGDAATETLAESAGGELATEAGLGLGAGLAAVGAGLLAFLWPRSTAPQWMDDINPVTGRPYASKQEYDDLRRQYREGKLDLAKKEPPGLNQDETDAVDKKNKGEPYDKGAYERAMRKVRQREKFEGERNKQKRKSN